jgi:helicase required for RNAi-mediated heterochromatin assembly 1
MEGNLPRTAASRALLDYDLKSLKGGNDEPWMTTPEIPTSAELAGDDGGEEGFPVNQIEGPWPSKTEYVRAHYRLLREDATHHLSASIAEVRDKPDMAEEGETHIYEQVRFLAS